MNKLNMKIVSFDKLTGTIEACFASDRAERPIEEYPRHPIQVVDEDGGSDLADVMKAIAQTGWQIAVQQQAAEDQAKNDTRMGQYAALVGQEFGYAAEDLFAAPKCCAADNQPTTEGLIEL